MKDYTEKYNTSNLNSGIETVAQSVTRTIGDKITILTEIVKFRITVLVSFTTALGYFLFAKDITIDFLFPVIGIFLLACGSAALNQYQERITDALMERTKKRPLSSGIVKPSSALYLSLLFILSGAAVLLFFTNIYSATAGLFTLFWYNFVYTPLKKKTAYAIIPGSLVGAVPPVAGWLSADGSLLDTKILFVAFYFFIWQIPHFWLLLLIYGKDYEAGGFPVLTSVTNNRTISYATVFLIYTTVALGTFLPFVVGCGFTVSFILIVTAGMMMIILSGNLLKENNLTKKQIIKIFISINLYTLFLITVLIADRFFYLF